MPPQPSVLRGGDGRIVSVSPNVSRAVLEEGQWPLFFPGRREVVDHPSRNNALVTDVYPQMSATYSSRMVSIQHFQRGVVDAQDTGGEHQCLEPEVDRLKASVDEESDHAHPGARSGIGQERTRAFVTVSVKTQLKR